MVSQAETICRARYANAALQAGQEPYLNPSFIFVIEIKFCMKLVKLLSSRLNGILKQAMLTYFILSCIKYVH